MTALASWKWLPTPRGVRHANYRYDYRCGVRCLQHHCCSTSRIEHLQAVSGSTTSLREKLFREDMQDRIRHMHEVLPKEIVGSVSRCRATGELRPEKGSNRDPRTCCH